MTYQDLLDECNRDGIGSRFWNLLLEVASRVARRYPPEVYNNGEQWSVEAIQDLAQDVALDRLLHENQLEYVLSLATDEDSLSVSWLSKFGGSLSTGDRSLSSTGC